MASQALPPLPGGAGFPASSAGLPGKEQVERLLAEIKARRRAE